jgi:hypothetical protein
MNAEVEYFEHDGYLLVRVGAPWTQNTAISAIDGAKSEAGKRGYNRIVFDLTKWVKPDMEITRFVSGEYLAKALRAPFKVAAYAAPEVINKFGENAAVNRGAIFRIFSDENAAIQWLMAGE